MKTSQDKAETRRSKWPYFLIFLLVAGASSNIFMVVLAVNDPSFAVEKDYYKKALNWDKEMDQQRQNKALGWKVKVSVKTTAAPKGTGTNETMLLTLRVLDRKAHPVTGASVVVDAYHGARASTRTRQIARPLDKAGYLVAMPLSRKGLWEFDISVRKAGKRFTTKARHVIGLTAKAD